MAPRQALTWDAYKACEGAPSETRILQIQPDGRWVTQSTIPSQAPALKVNECMLAYWKQAAQEGRVPPLPPTFTVKQADVRPGALAVSEPPVWSAGDEWLFSWEGPSGRGTYTWRVDREEMLADGPHYVLKSGARELLYRKSDLASSREMLNGVLVAENTPARQQYVWPLAVGARWEQTYRHERPVDKQTSDYLYAGRVEGEEMVTVAAGTFKTLHIVYRDRPRDSIAWEQWYAPDVRMWVKIREPLADGIRTRELIAFAPAR